MKWKGFSDDECTWEAAENLECFELIETYEREHPEDVKPAKGRGGRQSKAARTSDAAQEDMDTTMLWSSVAGESSKGATKKNEVIVDPVEKGEWSFELFQCPALNPVVVSMSPRTGVEAQEILEVARVNDGQLCFRVKWKDDHGSDWVLARVANYTIPQVVCRYYEELANPTATTVY